MYIRRSDFRPDRLPERFLTPADRRLFSPRVVSRFRQGFAAKHQARQRRHDHKAIGRGLMDWREEVEGGP